MAPFAANAKETLATKILSPNGSRYVPATDCKESLLATYPSAQSLSAAAATPKSISFGEIASATYAAPRTGPNAPRDIEM